jgi:hypothetical protein
MASANNNKEKIPSKDDHQNPKLKEEVEGEAEEKIEEDQHPCPRAIVASIGAVANPNKLKKGAHISTRGNVPRHFLAPRTSSLGDNPFHTLIHEHQFQRVPKAKLPSSWDIDRSNSVEKESFRPCLVLEFWWGLVGIIPTKPQIPVTSKNMFGTRLLGKFNPRQSPLFPTF